MKFFSNHLLALIPTIHNRKQKTIKFIFTLVILFLRVTNSYAQSQDTSLYRPVPPSPEVLSLFKFSQLPVSKFTGIPDISIPLYEVKGKRISVPIQLSYHSGGIKVTDVASSEGMGWILNFGGVITQTIRGINDYNPLYGRFLKATNMRNPSMCDVAAALYGQQDSEPDLFNYSFLDNSGSFVLDSLGHPVQIEEKKLKIESFTGTGGDFPVGGGMGWKITDNKGVQYIFETQESATSRGVQVVNNVPSTPSHGSLSTVTWYLNKIIDMPGDTIAFKYDVLNTVDYIYSSESIVPEPYKYFAISDAVSVNIDQSVPSNFYALNTTYLQQLVGRCPIKSITFPNGNIQFVSGGNRCDLSGDTYLGKIMINNAFNTKIKEYDLNYNYLIGNQFVPVSSVNCSGESPSTTIPTVNTPNNIVTRRLFLASIDEIDANNNKIDSYGMSYEASLGLPHRFSAQQDKWGYYNGNGYNSLLQNIVLDGGALQDFNTYSILGKDPNLTYAKQGILTKITYPTGGYSAFDYELNTKTTLNTVTHNTVAFIVPSGSAGSGQTLTTFTVYNSSVNISFEVDTCRYGISGVRGGFSIVNTTNNTVVVSEATIANQLTINNVVTLRLLAGSYALISSANNFPCTYQIKMFSWNDTPFPYTYIDKGYGGLRIKDIKTFDPVSQSFLQKQYQYVLPNGFSSLSLANYPIDYASSVIKYVVVDGAGKGYYYLQLNSNTNYPVATAQNGLFGYSYVTEKTINSIDNTDNGYTVFQSEPYDTDILFQDIHAYGGNGSDYTTSIPQKLQFTGDNFPWAPVGDLSWARGKPALEEQYKKNPDGTYFCIERKKYNYSAKFTDTTYAYTAGYRVHPGATDVKAGTIVCSNGFNVLIQPTDLLLFTPYRIYGGYQTLDSTSTERYDNPLNTIKTASYYNYNTSNLLPNVIKAINSKNEVNITNIKYPMDYPISGTPTDVIAQGIQNLQNQHVIDQAIEKYAQKSNIDGSNLRTTSAILTTYKPTTILPDIIYKWEPVPLGSASFSPLSINNSVVSKDINYQPKISFDAFDPYGNILKQHKVNGAYEAFQWGYNSEYVVAEAINTSNNDIFYDSFEEGNGNSTLGNAKTGHYSYSGTYAKALSGLDNGTYTLSYWSKTGSVWSLIVNNNVPVTGGGYTINLSGQIDDVRFYPTSAQMTTYTYDPLVGMTSSTDAKGLITYYEYDSFQRLMNIKDKDGNIVKHIDYHYQGQ